MSELKFASVLLLAASLAACSGGCSGKTDGPKGGTPAAGSGAPGTSSVAAGVGVPNPPFQGETPKGAFKVTDAEPGKYGGTLVIASPGNPKSFNPILQNESSTSEVISGPVFATCWGYDNLKQTEEPGLCEKYERSPDGLTYTFTLREGLQ